MEEKFFQFRDVPLTAREQTTLYNLGIKGYFKWWESYFHYAPSLQDMIDNLNRIMIGFTGTKYNFMEYAIELLNSEADL